MSTAFYYAIYLVVINDMLQYTHIVYPNIITELCIKCSFLQ